MALILLNPFISYSQEKIDSFNETTALPVLNEELRKINNEIRSNTAAIATSIPSGLIVMWSGSIATIPSGWILCDGSNGTPDLRDRFIICATSDDSGVAKTNVTGSLTQSGNGTIIEHLHSAGTLTGGAHTHTLSTDWGQGQGYGETPHDAWDRPNALETPTTLNSGSGGAVAVTGSTANYGTGTKNIAVYYALAFIQKT